MPNYTHTKLFITGDINQIKEIIGEEFLLKNTVPPPEGMIQKESAVGNEWFIDNWGVKWDVECYKTVITEKITQLKFTSPWETPLIWLQKTSELYPDLSFRLYWCDEDFPKSGKAIANAGEITGFNYTDGKIAEKYVKKHFYAMWDVHRGNDTEELSEASEDEYEKEYNILEKEWERLDEEIEKKLEEMADVEEKGDIDNPDDESSIRYKELDLEYEEIKRKMKEIEEKQEVINSVRFKFARDFIKIGNAIDEKYEEIRKIAKQIEESPNEELSLKMEFLQKECKELSKRKEELFNSKKEEENIESKDYDEDGLSTDCEDSESESLEVDERNYINNDSVEEIHNQHLNVRMFCDLMPILLQKDFEKLTNAIQNLK